MVRNSFTSGPVGEKFTTFQEWDKISQFQQPQTISKIRNQFSFLPKTKKKQVSWRKKTAMAKTQKKG